MASLEDGKDRRVGHVGTRRCVEGACLATGALLASDSPSLKNRVCTFTQGSAKGAAGSEL